MMFDADWTHPPYGRNRRLAKLGQPMTIADVRPPTPPLAPSLDRDTQLLSGLLEETIALQGGEALPRCRRAAAPRRGRARRAGEPGAEAEIAALTAAILDGDPLDVIRACSMELHLANLAETRERVRRRYGYERAGGPPQRESIAEAADRLASGAAAAHARRPAARPHASPPTRPRRRAGR